MITNYGEERLKFWGTATLAALLLFAASARAAFEDLGAGARGPGMSNAFTAIADDVYAIYYNPAGLALLERPELAAAYTQHLAGLSDGSGLNTSFLGYAQPLNRGNGVIGAAVQNFNIDGSFYSERAFYLSYGRAAPESIGLDNFYWGLNLKSLRRSFGSLPEAYDAYNNTGAHTGLPDPVLGGKSAVSAFDADLGLLYRLDRNYSAGLELLHLTRPNMAFSSADTDRLPLHAKCGFAYNNTLSNVIGQYETLISPTGSRDHRLTMAVERWFPWLLVGNIGARAALSIGSREFRQVTAGLSYHAGRISVDYGFSMPINTIASTSGSHRLSFSIRFGPAKEDESVKLVLEAMRSVKTGKAPEFTASEDASPTVNSAVNESLNRVRAMETEGRYREAADELLKALELAPQDKQLLGHQGRLNFLAVQLGRLSAYKTDSVQSALYRSALAYLGGSDEEAVNQAGYALSLRPGANYTADYLAQLELTTGLKSKKIDLPPETAAEVDNLLTMAAEAIEESRYEEAVYMSEAVLKHQPKNLTALENLGISHFAMGNYQKSLDAWETAYKLETGRARLAMINSQIESVENLIKQQKRKSEVPAPAAAAGKCVAAKVDAPLAQKFYREGLDLYSAGEAVKAAAVFRKVLEADPCNVPAANAIKRIQHEQNIN